MTLIQLRDRCNELLAGTCGPHYETSIENLRQSPGTMTLDFDNPLDAETLRLQDENDELASHVDNLETDVQRLEKLLKK